jgi:hypothetical protein
MGLTIFQACRQDNQTGLALSLCPWAHPRYVP